MTVSRISGPLEVCASRGGQVESVHLVDALIVDADGVVLQCHGDPECRTFPRSAIKALQALPLVESGAAAAAGYDARHLALACSSHNAEAMHVSLAEEMLVRAGLDGTCLECGAQLPALEEDRRQLVLDNRKATSVHNNCSGKHAGFLAFAAYVGMEPSGYISADHPVQRHIAATLEAEIGEPHGEDHGIDGCSIPTWPVSLSALAAAFARFGVCHSDSANRREAMKALRDACILHPELVAGTGRACTTIMQSLGSRAFVKVGAEGVYTAALPESGLGIALKVRDGATRAAEVAIASLIATLIDLTPDQAKGLEPVMNPQLYNWNGVSVGEISASAEK